MKKIQFNLKTILLLLALFAFLAPSSYAQDDDDKVSQNEPNWPSGKNKGIAKEQYALLIDAVNNEQFEEAIEPLNWILENAPNLHADVYVKAVKLYAGLAKKAGEDGRDSEVKVNQDKIAEMYQMRIKNGLAEDMNDIYRRFGRDAYFYWKDDASKTDTLYAHYKKTYEMDKDNFPRAQVIYYADAAGKVYEKEGMTLEEMTTIYGDLKKYVTDRIAKEQTAEEKDKWKTFVLDKIDELELIYFPKDCNRIADLFGEKLKASPNDTLLINRVVKLMADNGCTKEPLFLEAMQAFYKLTPTNAIANTIGQLHMQNGDTDKALTWIEKSLVGASAEEKEKAANTVLTLSKVAYKDGNYTKARSLSYKAAEMGNATVAANAYTFIGDLYMSTYKQCMQGDDIVQKRAVFLAAYDMYARGGDATKMASAKGQFPTKEDVFSNDKYKVGDSISVGCWIGVTTTIRTRD
ncbi:tetratricopeptide repeat protein [Bernardetia sp. MNP-M8]|uniref:tetratricopeptide repeat protein n=1 Tax=Bernardetia sp. MNP-M8 TaxID=3127470 RepID=UPI0030D1D4CD